MANTPMITVDSSSIEAVGYDESRRELHVRFDGGRAYAYLDVPENVFHELMRAESKGRYVNLYVKPVFRCRPL